MEANAEHDFCLKRLIGMLRTTKRAQYPLMPSPKRRCPAGLLSPESYNAKNKRRISTAPVNVYTRLLFLYRNFRFKQRSFVAFKYGRLYPVPSI